MAHSMGNVISSVALRSGMQVNRYAMCNAAVAAMAYDENMVSADAYPFTPDTDFDAVIRAGYGLKNQFNPVSTEIVNFTLPLDSALAQWALNNDMKPADLITTFYGYDPSLLPSARLFHVGLFGLRRSVTSVAEAIAYITRARSRTAGAVQDTRGSVSRFVNMGSGGFEFGTEHSAEWRRPIQWTYPFWLEAAKTFDVETGSRE